MDVYAALARFNIRELGHTQRQYAAIASKNHAHSVHNPRAQFRRSFTVAEILAAPPITYPLTLPMCAPISDGAAAAVLCTKSGLRALGRSADRAVKVLASGPGSNLRDRLSTTWGVWATASRGCPPRVDGKWRRFLGLRGSRLRHHHPGEELRASAMRTRRFRKCSRSYQASRSSPGRHPRGSSR
jgi:acetyl-CoA acetyltransferase